MSNNHRCISWDSHSLECEEINGTFKFFIAQHDYYGKECQVNFCPLCGMKAEKQIKYENHIQDEPCP